MELTPDNLRQLVVERRGRDRFTQDSPVMADVWVGFAAPGTRKLDLLLTPTAASNAAALAADLREKLDKAADARIAYSSAHVVARLNLEQLVHAVLPLSEWWRGVWKAMEGRESRPTGAGMAARRRATAELTWLEIVLGAIVTLRAAEPIPVDVSEEELRVIGGKLLRRDGELDRPEETPSLKRVTGNRPAYRAVYYSRRTVKADAVTQLFDVDCSDLAWAIVDSGIDATHPAFRLRAKNGRRYRRAFEASGVNRTRVLATYDMTRLRLAHRAVEEQNSNELEPAVAQIVAACGGDLERIGTNLLNRKPLDWAPLEPLLRVQHRAKADERGRKYEPPVDDHGTHVAGILAGDWPEAPKGGASYELIGICRDLRLYDIRVFPRERDDDPNGDEFTVSAALQFIDYLNSFGRKIEIAGANLSLSVPYELAAFGCGQTPVCQEANRLVAGGVVVVAAAGNQGSEEYALRDERVQGSRMISLTDPGNAEDVITVGSTHTTDPHAYGISHFSSRGPTADGRRKPDLVAPGEKIQAPAPGEGAAEKDGTSQATPHVSGAAALLLARHRELVGKPQRVKRLLMESATDLEREPYFQGAGLVDALRAAQAT